MKQFLSYLASGIGAAVLAVAAFAFLVQIGVWYVAASVVSDGVGLLSAFLFHKYLVFGKRDRMIPHAVRYGVVQVWNTLFQVCILYALVEFAGMDKVFSRVLSIGSTVPVNFFLYKYFVYI